MFLRCLGVPKLWGRACTTDLPVHVRLQEMELGLPGCHVHPHPPPLKPQGRAKGQTCSKRKESRSFHLYWMVLFFYLFANVQCNGLKPSRGAAAAHTQSCRGTSFPGEPSPQHRPLTEATPGQAARVPGVPQHPYRPAPPAPPPSTHTHN